jgi:Flp pilus assembly protein TadD
MRSADRAPAVRRITPALMFALAIALGGCGAISLTAPEGPSVDATGGATAGATATAATAATAATTATTATAATAAAPPLAAASATSATGPTSSPAMAAASTPPPVATWAEPVDPAAQRVFDDALRSLRAGRRDEAERVLKALAKSHPTLGGVHANLALVHRQAGRDAEAVTELETAVRLSPRQPLYLNQLGIAYRQVGQFAKAREAYERAIALDPTYAAPQLNLAILLDLYVGDRAGAADWYQRSALLMPNDAAQINKWLVELKGRKPEASVASAATVAATREKP